MTCLPLKDLKDASKRHYDGLIQIYCPALKTHVKFNADGFYHMIFKSNRKRRSITEQRSRLLLIPLIKPVLTTAKSIQETRNETNKHINGQKITTFFGLVSHVGKNRDVKIKVVVRKTGEGGYYFHSVMKMGKATKNTQNGCSL